MNRHQQQQDDDDDAQESLLNMAPGSRRPPPSSKMSDAASDTTGLPLTYSYNPKALVASYQRLQEKEQELLERSSSDVPMAATNGRRLVVAATQLSGAGLPDSDVAGYCFRAEQAIERAAKQGATLVLLPELWSGPYFCQSQREELLELAEPVATHSLLGRMQLLAKLHSVVLPVSIYERYNQVYYNSVVVIDADGTILPRTYRKSHIPDGAGYQEKFYFTPGDSGFCVYDTKVGKIGVAICWDQWFPEAARALALQGADVILYPTAIGSEPQNATLNSMEHWQRVMQGHAAANMVPVVASNRMGIEILLKDDGFEEEQRINFYGGSFITDATGAKVAEISTKRDIIAEPVQVITAEIDVEANRKARAAWGLFRDRRPDLYSILLTKDGSS